MATESIFFISFAFEYGKDKLFLTKFAFIRTNNYEDGAYSTIALSWDDTARSLTIGIRHGSFDGIEKTRTFTVNVLGEEKTAVYNGKETVVSF